jgi:hypothetical protein
MNKLHTAANRDARLYLAGQAIAGCVNLGLDANTIKVLAFDACLLADAVLERLAKTEHVEGVEPTGGVDLQEQLGGEW